MLFERTVHNHRLTQSVVFCCCPYWSIETKQWHRHQENCVTEMRQSIRGSLFGGETTKSILVLNAIMYRSLLWRNGALHCSDRYNVSFPRFSSSEASPDIVKYCCDKLFLHKILPWWKVFRCRVYLFNIFGRHFAHDCTVVKLKIGVKTWLQQWDVLIRILWMMLWSIPCDVVDFFFTRIS